jgi:hypothetical protein
LGDNAMQSPSSSWGSANSVSSQLVAVKWGFFSTVIVFWFVVFGFVDSIIKFFLFSVLSLLHCFTVELEDGFEKAKIVVNSLNLEFWSHD